MIPLILIHFIIIILFYCKNFYRKIEKKIEDISYGIKNWYLVIKEEKDKKEREMLKKLKEQKNEKNIIETNNILPPIYLKYKNLMKLKKNHLPT